MSIDTTIHDSALLIVDMQNDFVHPDGAAVRRSGEPDFAREMVPRLVGFLGAARQVGLRVIHARTQHSPWSLTPGSSTALKQQKAPIAFPGSWGAEFHAGLEPRSSADWQPPAHEFVVTKHRASAFIGTDLDMILRAQGIRRLFVAGVGTSTCVEATARDGAGLDYDVVVLSDCVACRELDRHEYSLRVMAATVGTVMSAAEITAAWQEAGLLARAAAAV
jgi:ureidoacrylate peracid hydrolase